MNSTAVTDRAPDTRVHQIGFPWRTAIGALLVICYLLVRAQPELLSFYRVPDILLAYDLTWPLFALLVLLILLDMAVYHRQRKRQNTEVQLLRQQIDDLWQSRKQLQLKAHTYSGHADKLKLFISDKLLEYIEYDEKFLHFKSIAAEVRHNGVISFDRVQTALQQAIRAVRYRNPRELDDMDVQGALDAMRYLWDLLDLSTADNLALHISNLLCECEEHYYQLMLNREDQAVLPFEPVYSPQHAAWRALSQVRHEQLLSAPDDSDYVLEDDQWYVALAPVGVLLGNPNHLVLLLENLLRNAQFFASRRSRKGQGGNIALILTEEQGQARLRVYNHGPHISAEDMPSLFQLGFSTRRAREHHGRGLGLYFVSEIVKGYEGQIRVTNISTPESVYSIRIELENGEVHTELLDVVIQDGQPLCRVGDAELCELWQWRFRAALHSIEITRAARSSDHGSVDKTRQLGDFVDKGKQVRVDPEHPERPLWQISYQPKRNDHQLSFTPLDIGGVEFDIVLPTARTRLESGEMTPGHDIDAEMERLDERFRERVSYE